MIGTHRIPEIKQCFRGCPACTKCANYYGGSGKCVQCYPRNDWCDCPNGIIRWWHRRDGKLIFLRLGHSPYDRGTISVTGREAIEAEKQYNEFKKEMDALRREKPRMFFTW